MQTSLRTFQPVCFVKCTRIVQIKYEYENEREAFPCPAAISIFTGAGSRFDPRCALVSGHPVERGWFDNTRLIDIPLAIYARATPRLNSE